MQLKSQYYYFSVLFSDSSPFPIRKKMRISSVVSAHTNITSCADKIAILQMVSKTTVTSCCAYRSRKCCCSPVEYRGILEVTFRASLSGTSLQRKDVVNQCLKFALKFVLERCEHVSRVLDLWENRKKKDFFFFFYKLIYKHRAGLCNIKSVSSISLPLRPSLSQSSHSVCLSPALI